MARRAIDRTLAAFFVASLTLLMKGIGSQGSHPFAFLSLVALSAGGSLLPLLVHVMMALLALEAVAFFPGVLLVIKEHVPGDVLEHNPERRLRRFDRVSGIADHCHQEQDHRQGIG
jgi:hypothetical protein